MLRPELPHLLIVDDEPGRHDLAAAHAREQGVQVTVLDPHDVTEDDLDGVDLVCVDEFLGNDWKQSVHRTAASLVALHNEDGIAVAAALRSRARLNVGEGQPGFGVALLTADLDTLSEGLPRTFQEPLTASQHDLEWVFQFAEGSAANLPRMIELAAAFRSARDAATAFAQDSGTGWLSLPDAHWADTARGHVDDCRPPAHQLSVSTHGRSFLRWLAQRVLPYPTFLLDAEHSANLLGITAASFDQLTASAVMKEVAAAYDGPLGDTFLGPRWWRAGLQQLLLDAQSSQWEPAPERAFALREHTGLNLTALSAEQAVIAHSFDGTVLSIDTEASEAVRIQIDGWPLYADDPWARVCDVVADDRLRTLVAFDDRARLESAS